MNNGRNIEPSPGFSLVDVYFVVFRRKWLILAFTVAGLITASAYYFLRPPPYQSTAKLMIKYVTDSRPENPVENGSQVASVSELNSTIMNSELQILSSLDLYKEVATNIGAGKVLAKIGGGNDDMTAASVISSGVEVEPSRESSVINITFRHPDATVVQPVLAAIIDAYREKHMQVHKAIGISDDFLTEKTLDLQQQISQIEEELRMAKTNAGIIDVDAETKNYSDEITRIQRELFQAQADLADRQALFSAMKAASTNNASTNGSPDANIPPDQYASYRAICDHLSFLQKRETGYLFQGYTAQNKLVMENRVLLDEATKLKQSMEATNPALASLDFSADSAPAYAPAGGGENSPSQAAMADLTSLPIRIQTLQSQLAQVQAAAVRMGDAETKISALMRKKQIKESYLENFASTLERRSIDESLGPEQLYSNIPKIEDPTPPYRDFKKFYKNVALLAIGGLAAGLLLAFLIEMYLDRSIKRPIEVQTKLKIPFFLSIPDLGQGNRKAIAESRRKQLANPNGVPAAGGAVAVRETPLEVMAWEVNRRFNSYYDALRDRLVVYFESINLTRKPKLVAVTSTHKGAGVSTIAAGLASSLSETGDGRVLLVDMNLENGAAQQFFRGKPSCKLDDALESETRDGALVSENLYVVTEDAFTDKLPRALPKRFASLIPKLKASDYDYIIFDMPPVSPTSVTARLSGFMDTVMLVIESEKTDQLVVQQASALLAQSKANVTAVLNKTKTYIPARLHQDFLSDV